MFTGLVEGTGEIVELRREGSSVAIALDIGALVDGVVLGDSIACSGCCLTVVKIDGSVAWFEAGEETLSKTILGKLKPRDLINVERSLRVGDRMGGHFVTGHVDGVGKLIRRVDDGPWSYFYFEAPTALLRQMASKGSITVDGVSLTLVEVTDSHFSIALIPHTLSVTTLGNLKLGDYVNLETDLLAKYAQRIAAS
jgi:riboflavin synthase